MKAGGSCATNSMMADFPAKRVFAKRPTGHGPTLALLKIIRRIEAIL